MSLSLTSIHLVRQQKAMLSLERLTFILDKIHLWIIDRTQLGKYIKTLFNILMKIILEKIYKEKFRRISKKVNKIVS